MLDSRVHEGARDDARLRAVVLREYDFVNRSMRGLGVVDADVDDATQQTFIVLMRRLDELPLGGERGFLFRTAVNVASNVRRGRSRRREAHPDELATAIAPTTPEELLDQRRALAVLDQLLDHLPMDLRAVFVLSEIEQMTAPEIASVIEIPQGTVASRLRRARAEFQRRLRMLPFHRLDHGGEEP
jgi:RNA polymerase sigma-70 factor (ECF subfamily)